MNKILLSFAVLLFSCFTFNNVLAQKNQKIKVLTYNANACRSLSNQNKVNVKDIASVIKKSKADLAAIQEVDVNVKRTGSVDQAAELAKLTGMNYYFAKGINLQGGEYGILILSKFPIKDSFRIELPNPAKEQRVLAGVQVELPNKKEIVFLNTNLGGLQVDRIPQAESIIATSMATDLPIILAGDFGATPVAPEINALDQHFMRTCPTENCDKTHPANAPTRAISHIMYRSKDQFKTLSHKVIDEGSYYASDQRPVFAELEFLQ